MIHCRVQALLENSSTYSEKTPHGAGHLHVGQCGVGHQLWLAVVTACGAMLSLFGLFSLLLL